MPTHKEIAADFFLMITSGRVREAYEKYVSPDFYHHNPYFKGDREALLKGMEENKVKFPNKVFEIKRQIEEGNLVVTHSLLRLSPDMPEMVVIHLVRFEDNKVIEMWDVGQEIPVDNLNENGVF